MKHRVKLPFVLLVDDWMVDHIKGIRNQWIFATLVLVFGHWLRENTFGLINHGMRTFDMIWIIDSVVSFHSFSVWIWRRILQKFFKNNRPSYGDRNR
jgi:hypothetical protein